MLEKTKNEIARIIWERDSEVSFGTKRFLNWEDVSENSKKEYLKTAELILKVIHEEDRTNYKN